MCYDRGFPRGQFGIIAGRNRVKIPIANTESLFWFSIRGPAVFIITTNRYWHLAENQRTPYTNYKKKQKKLVKATSIFDTYWLKH